MSEEEVADLPPLSETTAGNKSRLYKSRPGRNQDVTDHWEIKPVKDCSATAVSYLNYGLLNKSSGYDDDASHDLHRMVNRLAVQMKDGAFSGKDSTLVVAFLQEFKSACDAGRLYGSAALCLFNQLLTGRAEAEVKVRVTLKISANVYHEGALKFYYAIAQLLPMHYVTDDDIAELDAQV